ncbi:MAG TPA: DUF4139 domain-containing protein [Phycisphaerae bacterium]|nr:DUF4139 domain-containing protein [Phycisphaerae bacterium]
MIRKTTILLCGLACVAACASAAWGQGEPGVAVTVYNQGYAVVKEDRVVEIPDTQSVIKFVDVAQRIDPTSVYFKSLTDPEGTGVLEQNYEYDLVSADKLLAKYIDRPLSVWTTNGKRYEGTLLSFDAGQLVLKTPEGIAMVQRAQNVQDIQFAALPEGLLTKPTLVWKVAAGRTGKHLVRMAYQTTGMGWRADYNVVTNKDDTKVDVAGWVTVTNSSGATYKDARLKLIAGDVRRVEPPAPQRMMYEGARKAAAAMDAAMPEEKAFFEYHLYTFPNRTTLADSQVKQLQLLNAADVGVEKVYVYEAQTGRYWGGTYTDRSYGQTGNKKVKVMLEIANTKSNHLGMPLPAGKVRVFKRDEADNSLEFIGEDQIDHTKDTDTVRLYVGNAFDVNGEREVMDFTVETGRKRMQEKVRITLTSAKDEAVTVKVVEKMLRALTWRVTDKSDNFTKENAFTAHFDVEVPAKKGDEPGKKVIEYTVEYTW